MSECIERERGGSGRRWGRRIGLGMVLALLLAAVTPVAASAASTASANLTELSGREMLLSVSVTWGGGKGCGEGKSCFWFGFAEVFPASIEKCPPEYTKPFVAYWGGGVSTPGTESGTEIVNRGLNEGPLIVCVYAHHEVDELVGEFGPFDPQPPPAPPAPPVPLAPPPAPPPAPPTPYTYTQPVLTLTEAYADVEAFIRNRSGHAPRHLKDRCHVAEPSNREAECNASWFTDARVTKHTVEYTGVFRIEKFYFVGLHITFAGHRRQVGCTRHHSRKPCSSTVYW